MVNKESGDSEPSRACLDPFFFLSLPVTTDLQQQRTGQPAKIWRDLLPFFSEQPASDGPVLFQRVFFGSEACLPEKNPALPAFAAGGFDGFICR